MGMGEGHAAYGGCVTPIGLLGIIPGGSDGGGGGGCIMNGAGEGDAAYGGYTTDAGRDEDEGGIGGGGAM